MPHSTSHQAYNQALVQPKDIQVMGHCGKHMISPKEVMVDLRCSPLSNSQNMGHHLQEHLKCLQQYLEAIQSLSQHLLPVLHKDNFPAHLGDPPICLRKKHFQLAAETQRTDVAGIADLPPLPDICYDEYDADYESDNLSDLGLGGRQRLNQLKVNKIFLDAICQMD
jgi:hypothetical protein